MVLRSFDFIITTSTIVCEDRASGTGTERETVRRTGVDGSGHFDWLHLEELEHFETICLNIGQLAERGRCGERRCAAHHLDCSLCLRRRLCPIRHTVKCTDASAEKRGVQRREERSAAKKREKCSEEKREVQRREERSACRRLKR